MQEQKDLQSAGTTMREDIAGAACLVNADFHRYKWDGKGNDLYQNIQRLIVIDREFSELTDAVRDIREHSLQLELIQIASMCINWLRQYPDEEIMQALKATLDEHRQRVQQEFAVKDNDYHA